ncbi:hypothetical protein X741_30235 [Mesorhizobium sp. LNHC229A00]|nr:hypothetical protein X741_30235 [Mesorhizobium sp. LNHC229A00]
MLGDEIDTVSQPDHPRSNTIRKARIDFNDDWATLRPPEFDVRWPPTKAESPQTAQRNICYTYMLVIGQRGRKDAVAKDEMWSAVELSASNPNDCVSHYLGFVVWALSEFFDQYPR